ncbi:MAG TPA: HNH endonuclease, partial [Candidatus Hydrogenedentes bacterium]|nr:HNH endonuclease [Candidatus Hydrogenedentota bacterium]
NTRKKNRTPDEAGMPLLRKPIAPRWLPRFSLRIPPESLSTWQQFVDVAYWNVQIGTDEETV